MTREEYTEKLKDPRWQRKRLEVLVRDEWTCTVCFEKEQTLHVHHRCYIPDLNPWDYPEESLVTLCEDCHRQEHESKTLDDRLVAAFKKHFNYKERQSLIEEFEDRRFDGWDPWEFSSTAANRILFLLRSRAAMVFVSALQYAEWERDEERHAHDRHLKEWCKKTFVGKDGEK